MNDTTRDLIALLVLPVAIIAVGVIVFLTLLNNASALQFPITVILGVVVFVSTLIVAAVILRQLDISCKYEALGLPAGSIRSLIALSLIIIFVMLAIFLYPGMSARVDQLPSNVTTIYPNGTIISTYNSTSVLVEPSEAQKNFSLQALTTISTLVVAIASFYFGSKAVETARKVSGSALISKIVTNPSGSAEAVKGSPLTIKLENVPENIVVDDWKIYGDPKGKLGMVKYNIFEYIPTEEAQNEVLLSFGVTTNEKIKGELRVTISEKKKTEEEKKKAEALAQTQGQIQTEEEKKKAEALAQTQGQIQTEEEKKKARKTST